MAKCSGRCLCGKVSYSAKLKGGVGACHCGMCRRWSGGVFMTIHVEGNIDLVGDEHIARYSSSDWAERAFCKTCGTSLFYRLLPQPKMPSGEYILSAGTLNSQENLKFDHEVYVDHNPGWYKFCDERTRKCLTEADILALYGES